MKKLLFSLTFSAIFCSSLFANVANFTKPFGVSEFFHISSLYQNYFLPITYAKKTHDNRRHAESKFQFSLKKALFTDVTPLNLTLFFGYTQTSWWQTLAASAPFRESNYQPELFLNVPFERVKSLDGIQLGFLHESNGKDGEFSRSWNRVYLRANFITQSFIISPKIWWRVPEKEDDNPRISHYKGRGELDFYYRFKRQILGGKWTSNLRVGRQAKNSIQLEWVFPLFSSGFYGYVQYFNGRGESMIDYDKHTNRVGVGFLLFG